ncbi:MAG: response regulator [Clostridium sp.]|nr:response regulator [Clostridium sp.]MCM1546811.1 response regulator [Ruminococcus sp.]
MKYKILVSGKQAHVNDFIKHTSENLFSISTSSYIKDALNHFKILEPDAYIVFFDSTDGETIATINSLKDYPSYNSAPIIIVGTEEVCKNLSKTHPYIANLFIQRPISVDNIELSVTRYLEKLQAEKEAAKNDELQKEAEAEAAEADLNAKKHILVVDDDRSMLKMLKTALSDKYDVTTMVNGVLVGKFLDTNHVDMIILDHEMPIETGADVFKKLKSHPIGKNIPVCFLTGVSERSIIEEIMALKPHGYLLKPINMDMLLSTIHNLVM